MNTKDFRPQVPLRSKATGQSSNQPRTASWVAGASLWKRRQETNHWRPLHHPEKGGELLPNRFWAIAQGPVDDDAHPAYGVVVQVRHFGHDPARHNQKKLRFVLRQGFHGLIVGERCRDGPAGRPPAGPFSPPISTAVKGLIRRGPVLPGAESAGRRHSPRSCRP